MQDAKECGSVAAKRMAKRVSRKKPKGLGSPDHLSSWEQRFKELESFQQAHGHCNIPALWQTNPALGHWVRNLRHAKKRGTLAEEKVRRLDALGFCWERRPPVAAFWEQRINDLKAFKKEHGHCNVPHVYSPNRTLGYWVARIRKQRKREELDKEKIRDLDALGFCWTPQNTWDRHIHDLQAFKKEHGHCNVPTRYPLNPSLGLWVNSVRQGKKRGMLAEDKILLLDALGFSWVRKRHGVQVPWEQRIHDLQAFKNEHGHCNVSSRYQPDPTLGRWVENLRQRKKRGELAEDRIRILDALGFRWVREKRSKPPRKQR